MLNQLKKINKKVCNMYYIVKKQGRPVGCGDWSLEQTNLLIDEILKKGIDLNIRREILLGDHRNFSLIQKVIYFLF